MSAISDSERLARPRIGSRRREAGPLAGLRRRWNEAEPLVAPPREAWPLALRRIRVIGFAVLGIELVALCWWGALLAHRFALTADFATYGNALFQISHGTLLPVDSITGGSVLKGAFELILWPLAAVQAIWPHPVTLKLLAALAMVGAQGLALAWICDIAAVRATRERLTTAASVGLVGLGVVLLVANPWNAYSLSFDFHPEPFMVLALVGTARDLFRDRRTAWIWALLLCACSAVGATYLVAIGIGAAATGRYRLRRGLSMALFGLAWLLLVSALHAESYNSGVFLPLVDGTQKFSLHGAQSSSFDVVKAVVEHPGRAWSLFWPNHTNIWAALSSPGLVGVLWPPALLVSLLQSFETGFIPVKAGFSNPGFINNVMAGPLVTIGTVVLCAALLGNKRYRWAVAPLGVLLAANTVLWAVVWFPSFSGRWLTVSSATASTLRNVEGRIGPTDEVIASQGVVGAFTNRRWVYALTYDAPALIRARRVWLIVTPRAGIELQSPAESYSDIARISDLPGAHLVEARNGVWAFEWNPPAGTRKVSMAGSDTSVPAWITGGTSEHVVRRGNRSNWYAASSAKPGYALSGDYWREHPGNYVASVSLAVAAGPAPVKIEVWDDSMGKLLVRRMLGNTNGPTTVRLPVDVQTAPGDSAFGGWGLWKATPAAGPPGDSLEIRVWSPGGVGRVKVYSARLSVGG